MSDENWVGLSVKRAGLSNRQELPAASLWCGFARWAKILLPPQDCFLCGDWSGDALLCPYCLAQLPALPASCCRVCALPLAGELPLEICGACLIRPPQFDVTLARWQYAFPVDRLIQRLKYGGRLLLAKFLAEQWLGGLSPEQLARLRGFDAVAPVPLNILRLRERGFNQALELARPLARALGLPILPFNTVRRIRPTLPQAGLPLTERHKNIRRAFVCDKSVAGSHLLVVDDVMTTGATLNEMARVLKKSGAAQVANLVLARTLPGE